jgi:GNAT superfamily N-acetyltransferase
MKSDSNLIAASDPLIRNLGQRDVERGLVLSTEAGWNQTTLDWNLLMQTCHGWGVELPDQGLVGTAMVWPLSGSHAWINMVLVGVAFRGHGLALSMMKTILRELTQQGRVAFLDATAMGQGLYHKLGFNDGPELVRLATERAVIFEAKAGRPENGVRLMLAVDLPQVAILDDEVFGFNRLELLQNFHERYPHAAWVHQTADGKLTGFITARDGRDATQVGPLVATNRDDARRLLMCALSVINGPVIIDVPATDQKWLKELAALGFVPKRSFNRMTRGEVVLATNWSRYFAISGPDFA